MWLTPTRTNITDFNKTAADIPPSTSTSAAESSIFISSVEYRLVKLELLPQWILARSAEFSPSQLIVNVVCPSLIYSSAIISHYT